MSDDNINNRICVVDTPFLHSSAPLWVLCVSADGEITCPTVARALQSAMPLLRNYKSRARVGGISVGSCIVWQAQSVAGLGAGTKMRDMLLLVDRACGRAPSVPSYLQSACQESLSYLYNRARLHGLRRMAVLAPSGSLEYFTWCVPRLTVDIHIQEMR